MKKIDLYLIKSFLPPFFVTFFIALFILMMQTLWLYIDDIIGKGAGIFVVMEFLAYLSVSLFPMALPIAILISSVMVMGNLAERYELSSMKSAGVPLLYIIRSLIVVTAAIGLFSFICNNYISPLANRQFRARLYDIRKQKPTLNIEEGIFNDAFQGFVIRVGKKDENGTSIKDVMIYEQKDYDKLNEIVAKKGEMFTTSDKSYLIMNLKEGRRYEELEPDAKGNRKFGYIRMQFKEFNKVFDMTQFDLSRTDASLFKNQTMQNLDGLQSSIDSLNKRIDIRKQNSSTTFGNYFYYYQVKSKKQVDSLRNYVKRQNDSVVALRKAEELKKKPVKKIVIPKFKPQDKLNFTKIIEEEQAREKAQKDSLAAIAGNKTNEPVPIWVDKSKLKKATEDKASASTEAPIKTSEFILWMKDHVTADEYGNALNNSITNVDGLLGQVENMTTTLDKTYEARAKYIHEWHLKFALAAICVIFLFVGAPMGAIVQKGGFGYPILVAILFFMVYITLLIMFRKLAENGTVNAVFAAWIPDLILLVVGAFLTKKAMDDSKIMDLDRFTSFFKKIFKRKATATQK